MAATHLVQTLVRVTSFASSPATLADVLSTGDVLRVAVAAYVSLIGAVVASFVGVVAERLPRGEGIGGRSHCVCGAALGVRALVPVLGWLSYRGKASCCRAPIPARYPLSEAIFGGVWVAASLGWLAGGLTTSGLLSVLAGSTGALWLTMRLLTSHASR